MTTMAAPWYHGKRNHEYTMPNLPSVSLPWLNLSVPIQQTRQWLATPKVYPKDQHHAVLYPGLATPATSLALLHLALQSKGVVCHEWEQGFNTGITPDVEKKALEHLTRLMKAHPHAKWHLIGWSLGGLLAREMAKALPALGLKCTSVATMGTPINNMPDNQRVLTIYRLFNKELPADDIFFHKNLFVSPPCRSLSIYSRQDAIVPWRACIQSPLHKGHRVAMNHEVSPGHLAMINPPTTWSTLVQWISNTHTLANTHYQAHAEEETGAYWKERQAA